ncbi:MAG: DNRLRE domain-containing protein, partial [Verrucomicrobiaceae bacterium]
MKTIAKHVSAGILAVLLLDAGVGQAYAQVTQNIGIKSWANDVMSGYDDGSWVVNGTEYDPFVGNVNNLSGKTRMLLKFDISNISGTVTAADLDLTSFYRAGTNVVQVSSYDSNETSDTFTSADIADSLANSTPITTFTDTSGSGLQLHWNLDITSAVQTAKANGYSYVSFLLYSETANAITEA